MNRREFLYATLPAAAAVGMAMSPVPALAQAARQPQQAREGEIRITDVKTYNVGRLLIQITTDNGIDGWGESNQIPGVMADGILQVFKPLLIGMNPTRVEHIWQMLFRAHRNTRGGMLHTSVLGGIDMALWDIVGKVANQPLYVLFGGAARDRILFYPNARAHKGTTHRLHAMVETPAHLDAIVGELERTRERIGRGGYLMLDGHGKFTATVAMQLCRKIEHLDLLFFEEVVPPENNEDLARVARSTTVPLAAGERMAGIWSFRPVLEAQSADVLNPDVVGIGGISQLRKVAAMAEVYDLPLAPHSTHSLIGLSASMHVAASINNFLIHEAYRQRMPYVTGFEWPAEGTNLPLPGGPGLGVQVDMDGLADAVAAQAERGDGFFRRAYFLDDGSVADR